MCCGLFPLVSKLAVSPTIPVIIIIICDLVSGPRKTFHPLTRKVVFLQRRLYDIVPLSISLQSLGSNCSTTHAL